LLSDCVVQNVTRILNPAFENVVLGQASIAKFAQDLTFGLVIDAPDIGDFDCQLFDLVL
jgi:hypothetical protein